MNRQEMIPGQEYVVEKCGPGVYAGVHDGLLVAADGTEFYGGKGALRFVFQENGKKVVRLIGDGRSVVESVEARNLRVAAKQKRVENLDHAERIVTSYLAQYGIKVSKSYRDEGVRVSVNEAVSECILAGFRFGDLLRIGEGEPGEIDDEAGSWIASFVQAELERQVTGGGKQDEDEQDDDHDR